MSLRNHRNAEEKTDSSNLCQQGERQFDQLIIWFNDIFLHAEWLHNDRGGVSGKQQFLFCFRAFTAHVALQLSNDN